MVGGCPPLTKRVLIFDGVAKHGLISFNTNIIHYVLDGVTGPINMDDVSCPMGHGDMHTRCSNMGLEMLKLNASYM